MFRRYSLNYLILFSVLLAVTASAQNIVRVPGDYLQIQAAIDASSFGDTIQVTAKGESYRENLVLGDGIILESEGAEEVVIEGDNHYHTVVMGDDSAVRGFTIEGNPSCIYSSAENVIVEDNKLLGHYYGIFVEGGSVEIVDNDIKGAPPFIAVYCIGCSGLMENCEIEGAYLGVKIEDSSFEVRRCVIQGTDNGVNVESSTGAIFNCYVLNNNLDGVHLRDSDGFILANSVVWGSGKSLVRGVLCFDSSPIIANNIITECRFGIMTGPDATPMILHNDLYNNADGDYVDFLESDVEPSPGIGELNVDPQFAASAQSDFHLLATSACIDAGYTADDYKDLDGSATDMGAFGGPFAGWIGYRTAPSVRISANRDVLGIDDGEPFIVSINCVYRDQNTLEIDSYTAVEGDFGLLYLPWFTPEPQAERITIEPSLTEQTREILNMPDTEAIPLGDYTFYAAYAKPGTLDFYSGISSCEVSRVNKPVAVFSVTPDEARIGDTFDFDAGDSWDVEDDVRLLMVSWDWENDGTWDKGPTIKKATTHIYMSAGTKTIKLMVKDTEGYMGYATRQVIVTE
ncbi:right-handed parallel beta-helix repeat-containing protein [bacterium]|nr:right-handed parallel beta-helix repeat-containing protein [bacterium]